MPEYDRMVFNNLSKEDLASKQSPLVCRLKTVNGQDIQAVDPDAQDMSEQFPEDLIITVYQNGIPVTLSLTQLLTVHNKEA
jgi:hypothetical protein